MAFDALTYGAVTKLQNASVGEMEIVPTNFSSPNYVDAGSNFSQSTFPELALQYPAGFTGREFVEMPVPEFTSMGAVSTNTLGGIQACFTYSVDGYVIFSNGAIFKSTNGDLTSFVQIAKLNTADGPYVSINTAALCGNEIFFSTTSPGASYKVNIAAPGNVATRLSLPSDSNGWKFAYDGTGTWVAVNTTVPGRIIGKSSDGVNFSPVTTVMALTYTPSGVAYGNGRWIIVSDGIGTGGLISTVDFVGWQTATFAGGYSGGIAFNPVSNAWVVAPKLSLNSANLQYSTNGTTWSNASAIASNQIAAMVQVTADGTFVVSAGNSTPGPYCNLLATSNNTSGTAFTLKGSVIFPTQPGAALGAMQTAMAYGANVVVFGAAGVTYSQMSYAISTDKLTSFTQVVELTSTDKTKSVRAPVFITGNQVGIAIESLNTNDPLWLQGSTVTGLRTTNGGTSWSPWSFSLPNLSTVTTARMGFYKLITTPDRFILWGFGPYILGPSVTVGAINQAVVGYVSSDGLTWTNLNLNNSAGKPSQVLAKGSAIWVAPISGSSTAPYYYTTNDGTSWAGTSGLPVLGSQVFMQMCGKFFMIDTTGYGAFAINDGTTAFAAGNAVVFPGVPGAPVIGLYASSSTMAFAFGTNVSYGWFSLDAGLTWQKFTFPYTISSNAKLQIINGWFMVYNGQGRVYRSKDCINWDCQIIGGLKKYSVDWNSVSNSNDSTNSIGYLGGTSKANDGYFLASTNTKNGIPPIPAPYVGTKWAVRAKV